MQKSYRDNGIPDLRRNTHYKAEIDLNDLRYFAIRYFVPMIVMVTVILLSAMMVSATPNSNFPNNI